MKHKLLSVFVFAAGLLLSGCVVEEVPLAEHTILAVMEGDQTRTSVTDEGVFTWSNGDQVWLHTTGGGIVGTLSSGAGTSSAQFAYGAYFGDMTGKAVYPYNPGHSVSGDQLSVILPSSYDLGSNLSNTNAAMYGEVANGTIRFNHLAGVMRFVFKNVPVGTNKFQLTLDKKINGTFTADLSADYPVLEAEATSTASEKTVTLNFDALTAVSDISLYVPLPLGTYTTLGLDLWAGSQSVWSYSNTVTNIIGRKTLMLMPAVSMGGSIGGDIEGEDSSEEEEAILKLADGTPNNYSLQFGANQLVVPIESTVNVEVSIKYNNSSADWITYTDRLSKSSSRQELVFDIASNKGTSTRTAQIILGNSQLNDFITLSLSQDPFTGLDDSSLDVNKYITYVEDYEYEGSGDAFDYDMYYYGTTIYSAGLARAPKVEYKFKLNDFTSGSFYLTVDDYDDSVYPLYLNANGLNFGSTCYSWSDMGVSKTDIIILTLNGTTMIVNGKIIENTPSFNNYRSGYIWSGHYHERDDGMWYKDYTFQDGGRIYYAKGWDSNGVLIYIGGAALSADGRACWKSVYYDATSGNQVVQEHFPRVTSSFGTGNL
ncbi:MAG: hypothetical protein IJ450_01990 [Bacteroidales bacterium]|nr:hypothetical protein [Bacteroidales bacterium]